MTDETPPPAPAEPPAVDPSVDPAVDPTPPRRPRRSSAGPIQYKGEDLEAERGPGLGCFRFQLIVLVVFIFLTPLSVAWNWPSWVSAALLFAVILLLLLTGQTIIFLLRLVAADRRTRRRPLGSASKTVGELEDDAAARDEADGAPDRGGGPSSWARPSKAMASEPGATEPDRTDPLAGSASLPWSNRRHRAWATQHLETGSRTKAHP